MFLSLTGGINFDLAVKVLSKIFAVFPLLQLISNLWGDYLR